ncbi:hypothetical protein CFP56_031851 [Quercus suber]|uniref:Uncharacterized protein n=1 Tax=Quercus suber TaxID=58331 RepID=A0AAW0LU04_QUESU
MWMMLELFDRVLASKASSYRHASHFGGFAIWTQLELFDRVLANASHFGVLQWIQLELFDRVLTSIVILVFYIATTERQSWHAITLVRQRSSSLKTVFDLQRGSTKGSFNLLVEMPITARNQKVGEPLLSISIFV